MFYKVLATVGLSVVVWVGVEGALTLRQTRHLATSAAEELHQINNLLATKLTTITDDIHQTTGEVSKTLVQSRKAIANGSGDLHNIGLSVRRTVDSANVLISKDLSTVATNASLTLVAAQDTLLEQRNYIRPWMDCRGNGGCIPALIAGTLGSARATLADSSRVAKKVNVNIDPMLENINLVSVASVNASLSTAKTMDNLEQITTRIKKGPTGLLGRIFGWFW